MNVFKNGLKIKLLIGLKRISLRWKTTLSILVDVSVLSKECPYLYLNLYVKHCLIRHGAL